MNCMYEFILIYWEYAVTEFNFSPCLQFIGILYVDSFQAQSKPTVNSKKDGEKSDASAHKITSDSSTAMSSAPSNSKLHAATGSRRRNVTKPAHVLVKRWPKKSVKSSVKGRSLPVMSQPQPGDKLPVEIVFTWSTVDITWQVSMSYHHHK